MNVFIVILIVIFNIAIVGFGVYLIVKLLKNLASRDLFFTRVNEPEVKVILRGGIPVDCIANVKGHTMIYYNNAGKKEDWILVQNEELSDSWLASYSKFEHESIGGYFLYGILPNKSIAKTKINASRWKDEPEGIRDSLSYEPIEVTSLRAKTERRVVYKDVEIGGGSTLKIDVGFTVIITLVKPLVAMFDRRGNFGEMVDEALEEIIIREALKLTDENLFASATGTSTQIFDPKTILAELRERDNNIRNSGYYAVGLIYHGFDFTPDSKAFVEEKAKVREAVFKRAEKLQEAEADKKTLELRGQGRASALRDQISALKDLGVDPDVAAHVFGRMTVAEAIGSKDSDVSMFIEQGAGLQFAPGMMPQTNKKKGITP